MIKTHFFTDWKVITYGLGTIAVAIIMSKTGISDSLDARFYYSFAEADAFVKSLSADTTQKYLLNEFIDLALIFFYTSFLYVGFSRIFHSNFNGIKYLALIPGTFDFIETKSIILVLNKGIYPTIFHWLGYITAAKWLFGGLCFLILVISLLFRLRFFQLTKSSN